MSPLVQMPVLAKRPVLGSGCVAPAASESERDRVLACGVLLSSLFLAMNAYEVQAQASASTTPYYDVFGKRYHVRATSAGYRERGIASWYGRPFDGRPTSSGETYDMHEMTAAHQTLPIPTWVEVTNLTNGRRVTVKVNDRGPFVGKRLIDLSYAAATALDMVRDGTARVEVRALPGPPRETTASQPSNRDRRSTPAGRQSTPAREDGEAIESASLASVPAKSESDSPQPVTEPLPPPVESERLFAQAGKFRRRDDAVEVVESLRGQGLFNAFVVTEDGRRKSLHRVRVGPLTDAAAVERMNDRLRKLGVRHSRSVAMN